MLQLRLALPPMSKPRPRFQNGHAFMPANYRQWKDAAIAQFRTQYHGEPIAKILCLRIHLYGTVARGDCDNLAGSVMDALVQAEVLVNDHVAVIPRLEVDWSRDPASEGYIEVELVSA